MVTRTLLNVTLCVHYLSCLRTIYRRRKRDFFRMGFLKFAACYMTAVVLTVRNTRITSPKLYFLSTFHISKSIAVQLVNKLSAFYGIWRFITLITRVCHWSKYNFGDPVLTVTFHFDSYVSTLGLNISPGFSSDLCSLELPTKIYVFCSHPSLEY
jgi:hypothetical protein